MDFINNINKKTKDKALINYSKNDIDKYKDVIKKMYIYTKIYISTKIYIYHKK